VKQTAYTVQGLKRALGKLPKEASDELRAASKGIALDVAQEASSRARGLHPAARLVASSLTASRDRVPVVKLGGSRKLPPHSGGRARNGKRQTVGDIIWGAEFGGGGKPRSRQFPPHRGRDGYFLWPTVRENSKGIQAAYSRALDKALESI